MVKYIGLICTQQTVTMNITEAKRKDLVIESWNDEAEEFIPDKWRLIMEVRKNSIVVADPEYDTGEVIGIINVLWRSNLEYK